MRLRLAPGGLSANRSHIERHLAGSTTKGSQFAVTTWDEVVEIVAEAFSMLPLDTDELPRSHVLLVRDRPWVKVLVPMGRVIGTQGVVAIDSLPTGTKTRKELRGTGEDAHEVLVVDMRPCETENLVMDLRVGDGGLLLHSAYPGILAPDFEDAAFWKRHAFVVEG